MLYASHEDYLRISYDLVRRGIRFGANNWTPVRARSDVDPVRRNILATSDQLRELYRRGIYATGEHGSLEEAERELIIENLCARVDLPMNRVEVRTDEGGDSFELSVAKIVLKELLMLRIYADGDPDGGISPTTPRPLPGRGGMRRSRRAQGLDGVISRPDGMVGSGSAICSAKVLDETRSRWPKGSDAAVSSNHLREMAGGGPNPARARCDRGCIGELGSRAGCSPSGATVVPRELMLDLVASTPRNHRRGGRADRRPARDPRAARRRSSANFSMASRRWRGPSRSCRSGSTTADPTIVVEIRDRSNPRGRRARGRARQDPFGDQLSRTSDSTRC